MEIDLLKAFLAVAECGNISNAAGRLFISQSSLSKKLTKLEEELGVQLFNRTVRPIELTDQGKGLVQYARDITETSERMLEHVGSVKEAETKKINVAVNPMGYIYICKILKTNGKASRFNDVLQFHPLNSSECELALENETLHIALSNTPVLSNRIEYQRLLESHVRIAISKRHPVLRGREPDEDGNFSLSIDEIRAAKIEWFVAPDTTSMHQTEQQFFHRYQIGGLKHPIEYPGMRLFLAGIYDGAALTEWGKNFLDSYGLASVSVKELVLYRYLIAAKLKGAELTGQEVDFWRFLVSGSMNK